MDDNLSLSEKISEGVKKRYTGRAIPNVLTFFTGGEQEPIDPNDPVKPNEPAVFPNQKLKRITVIEVGLYVREKIGGVIIGFIPKGAYQDFNYIEYVDGMQKNGYQHCKVNVLEPIKVLNIKTKMDLFNMIHHAT